MAWLLSSIPVFAQYKAFDSEKKDPKGLPYSQEDYRYRTAYNSQFKHIDSTLNLDELNQMQFHFRDNFYFMPIYNTGSFTVPRTLNLNTSVTPYLWFQSRLNHFTPLAKYKFYDTKSVFSEIKYLSGNKYGQSIGITVTQSFDENLSYGIEYMGIKNKGEYNKSITDIDDINIFVRYQNTQYDLLYLMSRDLQTAKENGGIVKFEEFEETLDFLSRAAIETHFDRQNVFTEYQHQTQFVQQNLYLFRDKVDSLHRDNYLAMHGTFEYHRKEHMYRDDTTNYYNSPAFVAKTNDSIKMLTYMLKTGPKVKLGPHQLKAYYLYQNSEYQTQQRLYEDEPELLFNTGVQTNDYGLELGYSFRQGGLDFNSNYSHIVRGFSEGNHHLHLDATYHLDDWTIGAKADLVNQIPDLKLLVYRSNYSKFNWNNSFDKISHRTFSLNLNWQRYLGLTFKQQQVSNLIYYNGLWTPQQHQPTIYINSLEAESQLLFKYGGIDQRLLFQQLDVNPSILNLPQFTYRTNIFYNDYFWDRALLGRIGFQINYVSDFFGPRYNPVLGEFATQTEKNTGDYVIVDAVVSAKVKTMKIYAKYTNMGAWLNKRLDRIQVPYRYYSTFGYPSIDDEFQLGIVWYFFR